MRQDSGFGWAPCSPLCISYLTSQWGMFSGDSITVSSLLRWTGFTLHLNTSGTTALQWAAYSTGSSTCWSPVVQELAYEARRAQPLASGNAEKGQTGGSSAARA